MNKTIPIAIIIVGALIAGAVMYTNYSSPSEPSEQQEEILSLDQAAEKMMSFINEIVLQEQTTASLIEVLEENGLYKVKFEVEGDQVEWRITKDGRFIFPQAIDLTEIELEPEPANVSSLESFAKCLAEKGMKFYGASGCGWCQKQKELFETAAQYLPYIECSDEETGQLTAECQEAGISGFPTWMLPNGEKSSGFKSLEELSELSGCSIE